MYLILYGIHEEISHTTIKQIERPNKSYISKRNLSDLVTTFSYSVFNYCINDTVPTPPPY